MTDFHFQAITAEGKQVTGRIPAASAEAVVQQLQARAWLVVSVSDAMPAGTRRWQLDLSSRLMPLPVQQAFLSQLGTLLASGIVLDRALAITAELPETRAVQQGIHQIRQAIRGGASLSGAFSGSGLRFQPVVIPTIRAGERSGTLADTLSRLANHLADAHAFRTRVGNALVYPAILMVTVLLALGFLLSVVVPAFAPVFLGMDIRLPWYTRALLAASTLAQSYGVLVLVGLLLTVTVVITRFRHSAQHPRWDAFWLRMPVVGDLWRKSETARFCAGMGLMLGQGVPLLSALSECAALVQNARLRTALDDVRQAVKSGRALSAALAATGEFPHMAVQMIQAGEESGRLPAMLRDVADTFGRQTEQAANRLLAILVPAITLAMTALVGLLILAILLPIYDLTGALELP